MKYVLNGKCLDLVIIRKRNKNMYMRFKDSHTLVVTCNALVSVKRIESVLDSNSLSLEKMLAKKISEEEKDNYFYYLGKAYIPIYDSNVSNVFFDNGCIYFKNEKMRDNFYRSECFRIFNSELERILPSFNNIPDFSLRIRFMKTNWGVNNFSSHSITLNSELLKKDLDLLDYVIIHELCHFYEANHSSRFWDIVSNYYPKYKEARRRLRQ